MMRDRITVELGQLSATALWTLRDRALEAMRPDPLIDDPVAIAAFRHIEFDFAQFGRVRQSHVLRSLCFDRAVAEFAHQYPHGLVVALGDGLETGFWRSKTPSLRWLSVDLPAVIDLRRQVLPCDGRIDTLRCSAGDPRWTDHVDPSAGLLITAQGLLGYLQPADALALIDRCARTYPGASMVFDTVPAWLRRAARRGDDPVRQRMPFHLSVREAARLPRRLPSLAAVSELRLPPGRGLCGPIPFWIGYRIPLGSALRPTTTQARFADAPDTTR